MKKIILTLFAVLISLSAFSQQAKVIRVEQTAPMLLKTTNKEIYYDRDSVVISLKIEALNIKVASKRYVSLDLFITNGQGLQLQLPPVIFTGRYGFVQRAKHGIEPYVVIRKANGKPTSEIDYTVTVPYLKWMDHAALGINQVQYDCCSEWLLAQKILVEDIMVEPDPRVTLNPEMYIWRPDMALTAKMVGFMTPAVEDIKYRAATALLYVDYPVNVSRVIPSFGRNQNELQKVDTIIKMLQNSEFIKINSYKVTGFASPEGRFASNEALARIRSAGFKSYVIERYQLPGKAISNEWVGEDWEGLAKAVSESSMPHKNEILNIINTTPNPDARDAKIRDIDNKYTFNILLHEYYPPLRRTEFRVEYTVSSFTDEQAKELVFKRAELLSLDEMYRVALSYKPGSKEYRQIYEIAAQQFPNDVIANNNAAAAILLEGDANAAKAYLKKIEDDPRSYVNRGVVAYIEGDRAMAKECFRQAAAAGYGVGAKNQELIQNTKK